MQTHATKQGDLQLVGGSAITAEPSMKFLRYGLAGALSAFSTHAVLVPLDVSY